MRFSQRMGLTPKELPLQIDTMSDELRNSLWNYIAASTGSEFNDTWKDLWKVSRRFYFRLTADEVPYNARECHAWLKSSFMNFLWNEVYDFMEFYIRSKTLVFRDDWQKERYYRQIEEEINLILEREYSGFRLINYEFCPITDQIELDSIKQAINSTIGKYDNIKTHLQKAILLMSKRPGPDYLNSIKESISAVEGLCKMVSGESSGGIDKAIAILVKQTNIHPNLQDAFRKLYHYTSDEDGIRHPILEQSTVGLVEAKYMLVVCSAFVHYVIMKVEQIT